ncbi:E3 ubiquitin-protein ligase COP1-like isoform X3 [Ziziphus jujuba]|uniref:E3 ubiquitin-protein ligase COP1-like isoform X3 n=1 Tax=Ziziphus jujuba TaxID=326968 RepID=A0A6P3ZIQ8_ZIZJJ|nr:E3 ubiquitin-protein ligase COP1-like isoform X3 [Ziziphus jujuba]
MTKTVTNPPSTSHRHSAVLFFHHFFFFFFIRTPKLKSLTTKPHLLLLLLLCHSFIGSSNALIRTQKKKKQKKKKMGEIPSTGALVPAVKPEPSPESAAVEPSLPPEPQFQTTVDEDVIMEDADKDMLCPICMQIIKDAFLTACGHSFCYMCIVTHLHNKSNCPCCSHYLTVSHMFPNFLLDKILQFLKKNSSSQMANTASPFQNLRQALEQGHDMSIKELDGLLSLLSEKKRKMEQEEAETNMQLILSFLHCLKRQKLEELNEIQSDLQYIKEDINSVERHKIELYRGKERFLVRTRILVNDPLATNSWPSSIDEHGSAIINGAHSVPVVQMGSGNSQSQKPDVMPQTKFQGLQRKDAYSGLDLQSVTPSAMVVARKRQIYSQFNELQKCYLRKRRYWNRQSHKWEERDRNTVSREGYNLGLEDFQSVLSTFTRYSRLRVLAELRHGDLFQSPNIVSSIEFDRDDELFATAGVSRRIKVFEFSSVVNEPEDVHCPIVEMPTRSKLSCLSWNKNMKNHIASSDYEGIVTVWDITTCQSVMEYEEHEKRAWSVDFSHTEPSMLVSGSDDCKVGSADHHTHYYDLRNISQPLHTFSGTSKAVSYVKFLSNYELASASTDSTLRLWDVKENLPLGTYRGHTNEKNFVGLSVNSEYIACGSETNEVYVYHKAISKPMARYKIDSSELNENEDGSGSYFISAVSWKRDSPTMLAANSQGTLKVLVLAA